MILTLLGWAAGARWRLYLVGGLILAGIAALAVWRASIARTAVERERAAAQAASLANALKRAATDDEIRRLDPADRRDRLREWASPE